VPFSITCCTSSAQSWAAPIWRSTAHGTSTSTTMHTNEDVGRGPWVQPWPRTLGSRQGIQRFAILVAPSMRRLSRWCSTARGRPHLKYDLVIPAQRNRTYTTELVKEFRGGVNNSASRILQHPPARRRSTPTTSSRPASRPCQGLSLAVEIDPPPRRPGAQQARECLEQAGGRTRKRMVRT